MSEHSYRGFSFTSQKSAEDEDDLRASFKRPPSVFEADLKPVSGLLRSAYHYAQTQSVGDKYAREIEIANKLRTTPDLVAANQGEAEIAANESDWDRLQRMYPETARWMSNGENMRLAFDDDVGLTSFETGAKELRSIAAATGSTVSELLLSASAGFGGMLESAGHSMDLFGARSLYDKIGSAGGEQGSMLDEQTAEFGEEGKGATLGSLGYTGDERIGEHDFYDGVNILSSVVLNTMLGNYGGLTGQEFEGSSIRSGAEALQVTGNFIRENTNISRQAIAEYLGQYIPQDSYWYDLYQTTVQLAGQAGTFAVSRGAGTAMFALTGFEMGYSKAKAHEGVTEEQAMAAGALSAIVEMVSERTGADAIIKRIPEAARSSIIRALMDIAATGAINFGEEYLANMGHQLVEMGVYNPDHEMDFGTGFAEEEGLAGTAAALLRTFMHAATKGQALESTAERVARVRDSMNDLAHQAMASKVFDRSRAHFEEFAAGATEGQEAYVNPQAVRKILMQDGVVAEDLGTTDKEVSQAITSGNDIPVPVSKLIALADNEGFGDLLNDTRLDPGDLTPNEQVTAMDRADVIAEAEEAIAREDFDADTKNLANEVYDLFIGELDKSKFDRKISEQYATLHRAFATAMVQRGYATPDQMRKYYQVGVNAGVADTAIVMGQPVSADQVRSFLAEKAQALKDGEITAEQYNDIVNEVQPLVPFTEVPTPATNQEMFDALSKNKKEKINVPIEDGAKVGLRLDIPAYNQHGVWVPTIHGDKTSHRSTAAIKNVTFGLPENQAMRVAVGGAKAPFATMDGEFVNRTPEENAALAEEALNSDEWVQVGMNPVRHSFFYDKNDQRPVVAAEEVVQVGALVMAKNPTYGDQSKFLFQSDARSNDGLVNLINASSLSNAFSTADKNHFATNRDLKVHLQAAVQAAADEAGIDLTDISNPDTFAYLVETGIADALEALKENSNAVGWYDDTVTKALAVLGAIHPEINSDVNARFAFTYSLAVTSNGLKVDKNFELAEAAYREYKRTGRMPTNIQAGQAQEAINGSMATFNQLVEEWGIDELRLFMTGQTTVGAIKSLGLEVGGELVNTPVRGAAILGPKIGNGFFSNLYGDFSQLTMDRWLIRTWGRWTGSLIDYRPEMVAKKRGELVTAIDSLSDKARAEFESELGVDFGQEIDALAKQIFTLSTFAENREVMNRTEAGRLVRLAGNAVTKYNDGQKEAPQNGAERNEIRSVFNAVLANLQANGYADMTMADLQALLWYPEKRLYDKAKSKSDVADGYEEDEAPDYANAAIALAKRQGVEETEISEAIKEAENVVSTKRSAGAGSGERGSEVEVAPQQQADARKFTEFLRRRIFTPAVSSGAGNGKARLYRGRSLKRDLKARGVLTTFTPFVRAEQLLSHVDLPAIAVEQLDPEQHATTFQEAINAAKEGSPYGAAVYVYSVEEYKDMRLFMTPDQKSGFAIKSDGDIVSVFSDGGGKAHPMLALAVQEGGTKLDAFDTILPNIYAINGFVEVRRESWDDRYTPDGWDKETFSIYNNGEPDVVYMVHESVLAQEQGGKVFYQDEVYPQSSLAPFDRSFKSNVVPLENISGWQDAHAAERAVKFLSMTVNGENAPRRPPSVLQTDVDGEAFEVLDGRSGTTASKELGFTHIPVRVIDRLWYYNEETGEWFKPELEDPAEQEKLEQIYRTSARAKDKFDKKIEKIVQQVGGIALLPGLKGRDSAVRKINTKYLPRGKDANSISDILRGTIVVESADSLQDVHDMIVEMFGDFAEQPELMLLNGEQTAAGYSDMKYNIRLTDPDTGHTAVAELQVNIKEMMLAKSTWGHGFYEISRLLPIGDPQAAAIDHASHHFYDRALAIHSENPIASLDETMRLLDQAKSEAIEMLIGIVESNQVMESVNDLANSTNFDIEYLRPAFRTSNPIGTSDQLPSGLSQNARPPGATIAGTPSSLNSSQLSGIPSIENSIISNTSSGIVSHGDGVTNLNQTKGKKQVNRGSIAFPGTGVGTDTTVISLFENADLSTFLHESGHFFLEVMMDLAGQEGASQQLQDDVATLMEWFESDTVGTDEHEKFARGFELYLREGKAPSVELSTIFARFKGWLMEVYKNIKALNVTLKPEVTEVMDRMLATDKAIADAEGLYELVETFTSAEMAQISDSEYKNYINELIAVHEAGVRELDAEAIKAQMQAKSQAFLEERAEVQRAIEAQLSEMPIHRLRNFLTRGVLPNGLETDMEPFKLDAAAVREILGDEAGKVKSMVSAKDGEHPDLVAQMFGFRSGEAMLEELKDTPLFEKAVKAEVKREMDVRHPNFIESQAQLRQAAARIVHSNKRASLLARELRILEKKADIQPTDVAGIKMLAERIIGEKRMGDTRPDLYLRAMQRANREAIAAIKKVDFVAAAEAKQRQILNYHLYRISMNTKKTGEKGHRYLMSFMKNNKMKTVDQEYLDQIYNILEAYDLKKGVSMKEIERRKAFAEWYQETVEDEGMEVIIPADIIEKAKRKHIKDMTNDEFQTLVDSVKNIETFGKLKKKLITARDKRLFKEEVDKMVAAAEANVELRNRKRMPDGTNKSIINWMRSFKAEHTKVEFLMEQLDGVDEGPWWTNIFKPMVDAQNAEMELNRQYTELLEAIFEQIPLETRADWHGKMIEVTELGRTMNKSQIVAMALNWGNSGNIEALVDGFTADDGGKFTREYIKEVLDNYMEKQDWDFVQQVWDLLETLREPVFALHKEMTGVEPKAVQGESFETPHGKMRGGYYPLVYDTEESYRAFTREEAVDLKQSFATNFIKPMTRKGHTEARVGSGGQAVKLELSIIGQHVTNVVHDLTHRKAIWQVDKFIQNPQIEKVMAERLGTEFHRMLRPWLSHIANSTRQPASWLEKSVGHVRRGATIVNMGWKLSTAIVQPLGYLQSVELLGAGWAAKGLKEFYGNPMNAKAAIDFVFEQSPMMKHRNATFDRDIADQLRRIQRETKSGTVNRIKGLERSFFSHIGFMDMSVSIPTWLGAYHKAQHEGMEDPVAYADKIVRMSQSAGGAANLAIIQQGSEYQRMFTMFYSYFSVLYNLMRRRGIITKKGGWKEVTTAIMSTMYLVVLPAVLSELIAGRFPEDDEEEFLPWAAKKALVYPAMSMVGVRDLVNAAASGYGYEMTPLTSFGKALIRAGGSVDEDFEYSDSKNFLMSAGYIFGLPARQLWITQNNILAMLDGEDLDWSELLLIKEYRD